MTSCTSSLDRRPARLGSFSGGLSGRLALAGALLTPLLLLLLLSAGPARAEQIGAVDTAFILIGPDHKVVVDAYDDPGVAGDRKSTRLNSSHQ